MKIKHNISQTITAMEVRNRLGDLLARVSYAGEQFVIERRGKPVAVIMGIEEYRRYLKLKNQEYICTPDRIRSTDNVNDQRIDGALAIIQNALQETMVQSGVQDSLV